MFEGIIQFITSYDLTYLIDGFVSLGTNDWQGRVNQEEYYQVTPLQGRYKLQFYDDIGRQLDNDFICEVDRNTLQRLYNEKIIKTSKG